MPLAVGTRFGNIEILGHLGTGGMGEVYRGRDTKLDREVAVKVLPLEPKRAFNAEELKVLGLKRKAA
jgi:serine/threonine protein kinase